MIRVAIFTCSRSVFRGWNLKACLMMTTHTSIWVAPRNERLKSLKLGFLNFWYRKKAILIFSWLWNGKWYIYHFGVKNDPRLIEYIISNIWFWSVYDTSLIYLCWVTYRTVPITADLTFCGFSDVVEFCLVATAREQHRIFSEM